MSTRQTMFTFTPDPVTHALGQFRRAIEQQADTLKNMQFEAADEPRNPMP